VTTTYKCNNQNSTQDRGEKDGSGGDDTDANESVDGVVAVSLLSDEGNGGKLATTKAALTVKAEQQSVTKRGW